MITVANCDTPQKRRYLSRDEANEVIRHMYRTGNGNPDLKAYHCVSKKHWHVGHSKAHFHARIKLALYGTRYKDSRLKKA